MGGALVDVRGTTRARWVSGQSLPGAARLNPGGAARNVAVNLARLGYRAALLSAVGRDPLGDWLRLRTSEAGVDVAQVLTRPQPTGVYVTMGPEGGESWSISDAGPVEVLGAEELDGWQETLFGAAIVASDANLPEAVQHMLAQRLAAVPRVLLATSPQKAVRLRPVLAGAAVLVCNRAEALALTGLPDTLSWQALGTALLTEGVERVVLTHGPAGVAVLTAEEAVIAPAAQVAVVDPTGAGDAVAAVAVHAHLTGLDPSETAALAVAAAAIVVQSSDTTPQELETLIRP